MSIKEDESVDYSQLYRNIGRTIDEWVDGNIKKKGKSVVMNPFKLAHSGIAPAILLVHLHTGKEIDKTRKFFNEALDVALNQVKENFKG